MSNIVRVVDGFEFQLAAETKEAAEVARVTLTHLAAQLGYSDKSKLKQLAERHASELAEFGVAATVAVTVPGRFGQTIQEATYNSDQAAYLALSSETSVGRACRVRILKAFKALMAEFERPLSTAEQLLVSAQLMVQHERILSDHEQRVAQLEADRQRVHAELDAALELPPAPVEASDRSYGQMAVALYKTWAAEHGGEFQKATRVFYQAVLERPETRVDLRARLEFAKRNKERGKKQKRLCDLIDESGKSAEIYAIARQLFADKAA